MKEPEAPLRMGDWVNRQKELKGHVQTGSQEGVMEIFGRAGR